MKILSIAAISVIALSTSVQAGIDFGTLNSPYAAGVNPSGISLDGVSLTFTNLVTAVEGATSGYGFGPGNAVSSGDGASLFGGMFVTAPLAWASERPSGYVRTIEFDGPISNLSFVVADVDWKEGATIKAYDGGGTQLGLSIDVGGNDAASGVVGSGDQVAKIVNVPGFNVRKVEIIGNDPIGIDAIDFVAVPEPASLLAAMTAGALGLLFLRRRK